MATGIGEQLTSMKIRAIKIVLTLQNGVFPNTDANTKTIYSASLPGYLHVEATINRMPQFNGNTVTVNIFGMTKEDCEAATKFNTMWAQRSNQIQIYAGYLSDILPNAKDEFDQDSVIAAIDNLPLVFLGELIVAAPNYNNPNRPFMIQAIMIVQALATIAPSTNINSQTQLSTAIESMINAYNKTFPSIKYELNEVYPDSTINNAHYLGSFQQQLEQLCNDYGYQIRITFPSNSFTLDTQILTITRIGTAPPNSATTLLNSENGMIGSPVVLPFGLMAVEYYNPLRSINEAIELDTYFTAIQGVYYVWQIQSTLQTNGDVWQSILILNGINNTAYA